jgi:anti-sigma regulatory factor (Ser/Thr protein kinase)
MDHDQPAQAVSEEFAVADLHRVRDLVERAAASVGLAEHVTNNLVIAVNEIAVNAILYAGGKGRVMVDPEPAGLRVEIADYGPGLTEKNVTDERPDAEALGGRGLWLARQLCPDMTLSSSPEGLTVRMFAPRES